MLPGESRQAAFTVANTGTTPFVLAASLDPVAASSTDVHFAVGVGPCPSDVVSLTPIAGTPVQVGQTQTPSQAVTYCLSVTLDPGIASSAQGTTVLDGFTLYLSANQASGGWSASLTATGSVSAGSLSVGTGGPLPALTFTNSSLSSTASVTISNSTAAGATAPSADLAVTFTGSSGPLAGVTNLVVWSAPDSSGCADTSTPGPDAVTGVWASGVTSTMSSVPAGSTRTICVRSTVNARQDAASSSGSLSFAASVQARLTLHNFSAQSSSNSTVGSSSIYPFSTLGNFWYTFRPASDLSRCLDVTGGINAAPGTLLGTWTCHTSFDPGFANQWFTLAPASGSLVGIRSAVNANLYATANGNGTVTMEVRNDLNPSQKWEPQLIGSGVFQLVNDPTGLCLAAVVTPGPLALATCNGSTSQMFAATQLTVPPPTG